MVLLAVAWLIGALGCGSEPNSDIVEFCIPLEEAETGLPVARVILEYDRYSADTRPGFEDTSRFLVATESPFTLVDATALSEGEPLADASALERRTILLAVVDSVADKVVGRAAFWDLPALVTTMPPLGTGEGRHYDGLLGGNLLARHAVRLQLQDDLTCRLPWLDTSPRRPSITFFREFSDHTVDLSSDGFGVIDFDLAGGGTLLLEDREYEFGATRVTLGACLEPAPFDPEDPAIASVADIPSSGLDAQILVATGTAPMVMGQALFSRLLETKQAQDPGYVADTTSTSIYLPEGSVPSQQLSLLRMALVGDKSGDLGPCLELQRRRQIEWVERRAAEPENTLGDDDRRVLRLHGAAVLEVDTQRGDPAASDLTTHVVADNTVLFSGLRSELGAKVPVVSVLVGAAFLQHFELVIDYPGSRVVMRCVDYKLPLSRGECVSDSSLSAAGKSCCQVIGPRSCRCHATPCCQYFRYVPEKN